MNIQALLKKGRRQSQKKNIFLIVVVSFLLVKSATPTTSTTDDDEDIAQGFLYHPYVTMGQIDNDDLPITGLTGEQARDLLFQRYRARMMHHHAEPHVFTLEDISDKEIGEICGNSASLECGKKVLKFPESGQGNENEGENNNNKSKGKTPKGQYEEADVIVYQRCHMRKEFLACIDVQRQSCRHQAEKGIYPRLPPKSIMRSTQSKIWRALWTSGGCTLVA